MSDSGEVEVETISGYQVLPKEVTDEIGSIKLFNKWAYDDVEVRDISLTWVHFDTLAQVMRFWKKLSYREIPEKRLQPAYCILIKAIY